MRGTLLSAMMLVACGGDMGSRVQGLRHKRQVTESPGAYSLHVPEVYVVRSRPLPLYRDVLTETETAYSSLSISADLRVCCGSAVTSADKITITRRTRGSSLLDTRITSGGRVDGRSLSRVVSYPALRSTSAGDVVLVGDSIVAQGYVVDDVLGLLPTGWTSRGTHGPTAGGELHEAVSGYGWTSHKTSGAMSPGTPAAITSYISTIGATPRVVVWVLWVGGVTPIFATAINGGDVEAAYTDEKAAADVLLSSWASASPGTLHLIATPVPASSYPPHWSAGDQWEWEQAQRDIVRWIDRDYGDRESEGIFICPIHVSMDPDTGWAGSDKIHPNSTGHAQMAEAIYAGITRALQYRSGQ